MWLPENARRLFLAAANANNQSILSALQMQPGLASGQINSLAASGTLPFQGVNSYADLINALTGRYGTTNSSGTSTGKNPNSIMEGLGQLGSLAGGAALAFSDRRLKTDIKMVGSEPDGLGIYSFRYVWGGRVQRGVMADEVANLRPWALGPQVEGFATVNYGAL